MTDTFGLWFHRAGMLVASPFIWALATVAYVATAPCTAADAVVAAIKMHWNDR